MQLLLFAAVGGAIGAGARHLVNVGVGRWLGGTFPWSTLIVNIVGCALMGALFVYFVARWPEHHTARTFLATGILGGFTTFSAFALDFWVLFERQAHVAAALYLAGSVVASLVAFVGGLALARAVLG
jgi:CrcB protein